MKFVLVIAMLINKTLQYDANYTRDSYSCKLMPFNAPTTNNTSVHIIVQRANQSWCFILQYRDIVRHL